MLYVENDDKPGFIGALGAALGDAGVNIATFNLGRKTAGGDALALVGIDEIPASSLLEALRGMPHVRDAKALAF
jgi:D-3-phosphoglycerate dehydrogenase